MIYQKLLVGKCPYLVSVGGKIDTFVKHRHPEIELNYCSGGTCPVNVDNKKYVLKSGELMVIGSMIAHEYPENNDNSCRMTVIELGPVLLPGYFEMLVKAIGENILMRVDENNKPELYALFNEIMDIYKNPGDFADLMIKGSLYKICAYMLRETENNCEANNNSKEIRLVSNIEKALELIYDEYATNLTVERAAEVCGYGKSNFCKIFRRITGDTFHNVLNRYRITMACNLLDKTNYSVDQIATEVGFSETKTLCRVFKSVMGMTTGEYRKKNK